MAACCRIFARTALPTDTSGHPRHSPGFWIHHIGSDRLRRFPHGADYLIVAATGYKNQQDVVRHFMGDVIADRIGPVWGFDQGGELRNMWCRTAQPGLWFVGGGLPHVRIFSKYLAQQIKACEVGLIERRLETAVAPPMDRVA